MILSNVALVLILFMLFMFQSFVEAVEIVLLAVFFNETTVKTDFCDTFRAKLFINETFPLSLRS